MHFSRSLMRFSLSFMPFLSLPALASSFTQYAGHSDYRLFILNPPEAAFDFNEDLVNPSGKTLAIEKIRNAVFAAGTQSLIPMMSELSQSVPSGKADLLTNLLSMTETLRKSLSPQNASNELSKAITEAKSLAGTDSTLFPQMNKVFIAPWGLTNDINFNASVLSYGTDKFNIQAVKNVNVMRGSYGKTFDKRLNENITALQKKLYDQVKALPKASRPPAQLLASEAFIFVAPDKVELTLDLLLCLTPRTEKFEQENPQVKFDTMEIPEVGKKGSELPPVAVLTLNLDLSDSKKDPEVFVQLGEFEKYEERVHETSKDDDQSNFHILNSKKENAALTLNGVLKEITINKWGINKKIDLTKHPILKLRFAFREMNLDLVKHKLANLHTIVSPGLDIGSSRFRFGAFHLLDADQGFQDEINKNLDAELEKAQVGLKTKLDSEVMSTEWMTKLFNQALGHKPEI